MINNPSRSNNIDWKVIRWFIFLWFTYTNQAAADSEPVAQIVVCTPDTVRVDAHGNNASLQRRSSLFEGDTIITTPNGAAQLRFQDGTGIALGNGSRYRIVAAQLSGVADQSKSLVAELVQGSLRSVSGAISKQHPQGYALRAGQITIGIRGTNFDVALANATTVGLTQGEIVLSLGQTETSVSDQQGPRFARLAAHQSKDFFAMNKIELLDNEPDALHHARQARARFVAETSAQSSKAFPPLAAEELQLLIEEP